ncbi:hypothetical protein E3O62_03830 [Cryobacterium sp. TMT2-15-1]|nr:hypothetical protein E3O62_03830 [Cryobacterium sp. TMT2-15-1]
MKMEKVIRMTKEAVGAATSNEKLQAEGKTGHKIRAKASRKDSRFFKNDHGSAPELGDSSGGRSGQGVTLNVRLPNRTPEIGGPA